jgi:DNA-binding PadR family transcriptional regulator
MSVRFSLLGLLAQKPRYGYELSSAFTALAGGRENWDVKPGQIYTTLSRMVDAGWINAEFENGTRSPEKRMYTITTSGHEELLNWFRSSSLNSPQQDEFYFKLMLSLDLEEVDASRMIQIQRNALYQELHRITTRRQEKDPQRELAQILLMDKAVMHLEADLRWLEMIEARLDEVQKQPVPKPELRPRGRPPSR